MKDLRLAALVVAALTALAAFVAWLPRAASFATGSALSRDADGWLVARRYLEERGARVRLLDEPFESEEATVRASDADTYQPGNGALVLTFPWQRLPLVEPRAGLERHLRAGGVVVLAYTGELLSWGDEAAASALGLEWRELRGDPPLWPSRWRAFAREEWTLRRAGAPVSEPEPRVSPPRRAPRAPAGAQTWYVGPDGEPLVFAYPRAGGRVVVLPANVLANARLGRQGNADLLESLLVSLGPAWTFDEYHHGLSPAAAAPDAHLQRSFDVYLIHVALVYVLALLALARRFGPAWSEPAPVGGSTGAFLLGIGALHRRLGHHAAGARHLVERARELDPRLRLPDADPRGADDAGLLALARAVGRAQAEGGRTR